MTSTDSIPSVGGASNPLVEQLHGLWVLATNLSFLLLVREGLARRSAFYTALFLALGGLSFALHCEETGLCAPLAPTLHLRLQVADLGLSYFLFCVMALVVLEVRMAVTGRLVAGALAVAITARDVLDVRTNVLACLVFGAVMLAVDAVVNHRRFRPAWWRRLALIAGMAAAGALLFKALKTLWAVHGLWHIYYVTCCYLLLLAERQKRDRATATAAGVAGIRTVLTSGAATSWPSMNVAGGPTPVKRSGKAPAEEGVV